MTKRKSIITSALIMIPIGGIVVFLIQTNIWTSLPFVYLIALYGFGHLWLDVISWLQCPDSGEPIFRRRRNKNTDDFGRHFH